METILDRIKEIQGLKKDQCWYITKQSLNFKDLCFATKIIEDFQNTPKDMNIQDFFATEANKYSISTNHRFANNCYYVGLLQKNGSKYADAIPTPIYKEIKNRCKGDFSLIDLYKDLMISQIEKVFITNPIDEESQRARANFRIHPAYFLAKVLIVLGEVTSNYSITMKEFKSYIGTSFNYRYYLSTVSIILESRKKTEIIDQLDFIDDYYSEIQQIGDSNFDGNRLNLLLNNLPYFKIDKNIELNLKYLNEVKYKLYKYELDSNNPEYFTETFLCSESFLPGRDFNKPKNDGLSQIVPTLKKYPRQKIIYGAPGTGKSYELQRQVTEDLKILETNTKRVTFHPNYSYQQFIGTYKPTPIYKDVASEVKLYNSTKREELSVGENKEPIIDYTFVPGPFLSLLIEAMKEENREIPYMLIIEEINRASVASVFGDIFQLLDRDKDGTSEYEIEFNADVTNYLISRGIDEKSIRIPNNLFIWATMNSADQGVMPLDSAFKRRWSFEYLELDKKADVVSKLSVKFLDQEYSWNKFRNILNDKLISLSIPEDKLIGPFFLKESELKDNNAIKNKLLIYLKDDVVRHNPETLFTKRTFSGIIKEYDAGKNVFVDLDLSDAVFSEKTANTEENSESE